jgi:hypothetical protein
MIATVAGLVCGRSELKAQTYLTDVYDELEQLYPEPTFGDSVVTVWLAMNVEQSGFRLRFDPTSDDLPAVVWWSRPRDSERRLWPVPCESLTRSELIESCRGRWPQDFSAAELQRRLTEAGALPFPARSPLTGPPPLPPCPDDGWDLWILRGDFESGRDIHYCNFNYRWVPRGAAEKVIDELMAVWRSIEDGF